MSHYSPISHNDGLAPYLREYIRNYMKDWCGSHKKIDGEYYDVHKDGLRIYTTIDSRMQAHAEKAVEKHMKEVIQPAFFKELARRNGNPFNKLTKEQEEHFLTLAMKASDRYYQMKQDGASESEIKKYFKQLTFKTAIPRNVRVAEAPSHGVPVGAYDNFSKGAKAYKEFTKELEERTK